MPSYQSVWVSVGLGIFVLSAGCSDHAAPTGKTAIVTHAVQPLGSGVTVQQIDLPGGDGTRTLWVYLPKLAAGAHVPCVFVAPAGTPCFFGGGLGDGTYRAEHLPYARAGFAVIAYSLDGSLDEKPKSATEAVTAIQSFEDAHAGVDNAKAAIDYAIAHVPQIDPKKLYVAGHSSAGVVALLAAENEKRLAGCIAYAPACDLPKRLGEQKIQTIGSEVPDFGTFIYDFSPNTHATNIVCPLFLFHADDDSNVPTSDVVSFANQVKTVNSHVTLSRVPTGDHYDSMIEQGIPQAIAWVKSQAH